MASGFLELAYLGEISIVFNLAYAELKSERYFQKAQKIISELRAKLEYNEYIHRDLSDLFSRLANIDSKLAGKRRNAWSNGEEGLRKSLIIWFFADCCYGFLDNQHDKRVAMWAVFITSMILIFATINDHFHWVPSDGYSWFLCFFLLMICLVYPPLVILAGRGMRSQLENVAINTAKIFTSEKRPGIMDLIAQADKTL